MNENIDLAKILKNCPTGFELYSSVYGKVKFVSIDEKYTYSWINIITENNIYINFTSEGKLSIKHNGECVLFPSKEQRDWSKFTAPWYKKEENLIKPKFKVGDIIRHKENNRGNVYKIHRVYDDLYVIDDFAGGIYIKNQDQYELVSNKFDPKILKPFDRVIVKPDNGNWHCSILSHREDNNIYYRMVDGYGYSRIIPYNDDTKHIVGTNEEVPEFYKYWEN